ncbi:hypothetical protein NHQ30_008406 [Ciborinia camelliae]|nr:hypothetical protein NHQ30_008406 [Ciborinia camelliae]
MVDSRLLEEFEKMEAPQLRHLLSLVCDNKSFSLKHRCGKLTVTAEKVCVTVAGFHDWKTGFSNFEDCENYKEGDETEEEVEDVPSKSKIEIEKLVKSNKRKFPDSDPTMFHCERCYMDFDIFNNPSNDCLWHPGTRTTDLTDIIWADHDVKKDGAIEDLIDHPDFEDRWVWSCCGELGSDWGCKCTRHTVGEEFEEIEDSSEDLPEDSSNSESEEVEEPAPKRVKC